MKRIEFLIDESLSNFPIKLPPLICDFLPFLKETPISFWIRGIGNGSRSHRRRDSVSHYLEIIGSEIKSIVWRRVTYCFLRLVEIHGR